MKVLELRAEDSLHVWLASMWQCGCSCTAQAFEVASWVAVLY